MKKYASNRFDGVADASCPVVLDLYGHDFALPSFAAADNVVSYFKQHPELQVEAFYSTPAAFYKEMHAYKNCSRREWTVFGPDGTNSNVLSSQATTLGSAINDFFPYWTGFFSSQPLFKAMVRRGSSQPERKTPSFLRLAQ